MLLFVCLFAVVCYPPWVTTQCVQVFWQQLEMHVVQFQNAARNASYCTVAGCAVIVLVALQVHLAAAEFACMLTRLSVVSRAVLAFLFLCFRRWLPACFGLCVRFVTATEAPPTGTLDAFWSQCLIFEYARCIARYLGLDNCGDFCYII